MTFFTELDKIMKQDMGGRGFLGTLPANPVKEIFHTLKSVKRAILLSGFPVRMADGSFIGETDGPSGTANLAYALTEAGADVLVVTDKASFHLLEEALRYRAPKAKLALLPEASTETFIQSTIRTFAPTHFFSLERPGKAANGHYHNMRGEFIDDMITDSALFLTEAKAYGAVTVCIGDGGNEMGMGSFHDEIVAHVPCGETICAAGCADLPLTSGVSNWWGWGIASLLSLQTEKNLLPSDEEETELLHRVVMAGGVDGCTKENVETVDNLSLETHLSVLRAVRELFNRECASRSGNH